jgi:hypothetical protein
MMTSAQSLLEIFTLATMKGNLPDRFLSVAAEVIGLTSEDREAEALLLIARAIRRVKTDIEGLNFPEEQKQLLRDKINVFNPLLSFEHSHFNNAQMRENCLNSGNLIGLTFIHMSLAGFRRLAELDRGAQGLADEFRTIREDLSMSNLPESLKEVIILRLNQIAAALDHFAFFGTHRIEQEFASLVGELLVRKVDITKSDKGVIQRILKLLQRAAGAVKTANDVVSQGQMAVENGTELYLGISELLK